MSKGIIVIGTTLMLVLTLTTLAALWAKPTPPIVSACMKLAPYATRTTASSQASMCACFEATAKRQLDEGNYQALDQAAQVVLEKSMSGKRELIQQAITTRAIEKPSITSLSMTAADFILLMHKFSNRCIAG